MDKENEDTKDARETGEEKISLSNDALQDVAAGYKPEYHHCMTCGAEFVGKAADGEAFVRYHQSLYHTVY